MKFVYLINQQDRWCPENNNGDCFIEAWSNEAAAEARAAKLNKPKDWACFYMCKLPLDMAEDEAAQALYGDSAI
jgi:hypothetical protein